MSIKDRMNKVKALNEVKLTAAKLYIYHSIRERSTARLIHYTVEGASTIQPFSFH